MCQAWIAPTAAIALHRHKLPHWPILWHQQDRLVLRVLKPKRQELLELPRSAAPREDAGRRGGPEGSGRP